MSFWIHGTLTPQWKLFYQTTSSFGRVERDLIVIRLDRNSHLSAYLVDARYDRHEIVSTNAVTGEDWKHIVLTWDMTSGMALYLNGEQVASSMGEDAWWMALAPGIFHLPSGGCTYDELYIMDRPINEKEVSDLYTANKPPEQEKPAVKKVPGASVRLAEKSGISTGLNLPVAVPSTGDKTLNFEDLWNNKASDGHVPGWWVNDGRYVLAWPHPYAFWTITIGDMDFHAEKVDLGIPPGKTVNYITLEGNLDGVKVHALEDGQGINTQTLLDVPAGHGFFYGSRVSPVTGKTLRIPFVREWGTPYHYKGDLNLPLTGATRIHEIGLFNVTENKQRAGTTLYITGDDPELDTARYGFAVKSLVHRRNSMLASAAKKKPDSKGRFIDTGAFRRLNIFTQTHRETYGIASLCLNLYIKTSDNEDVLLVRLRDPAVPSGIWTHAEVKLKGFDKNEPGLLSLTLDITDLVLVAGDRIWLDVCSAKGAEILIGDKHKPSSLTIETVPVAKALVGYSQRELYTAQTEFSASNEYPLWVGDVHTDFLTPMVWSGIFDKVYPVQAVRRVDPDNTLAKYLRDFASGRYYGMTLRDTTSFAYKEIDIPDGVPVWAAYMREYLKLRNDIGNWWADHQNPDGQLGGGWNDDTTQLIFGMIDLPLDGNKRVLRAINLCREGFDKTRMFEDGYMQLYPMDRHHTRDPVRAFHNLVLINSGNAHYMEQAMEIGRHYGHPESTPIHYSKGIPFEAANTVVQWYWGLDRPQEPYTGPDEETLADNLRYLYSYFDSTLVWFSTEAYKELGGSIVYGSYEFMPVFLGGSTRRYPHHDLAVSWPKGGGPDVARRVEYADDTTLKVRLYSFDERERTLTARLYRLKKGKYSVVLAPDRNNDGNPDRNPEAEIMEIRRFSDIDLTLQPGVPMILQIKQVENYGDYEPCADLAVDPGDIRVSNTYVTVTVHNIGNAPANDFKVTLFAGNKPLGTQTIPFIDAPLDFIPKTYTLQFTFKSGGERIEAVVDPGGSVDEIMKRNNHAVAADYRGDDYFDWSDIPYVP